MARQSVLGDEPWDTFNEAQRTGTRVFTRAVEDALSASPYELSPG